MVGDIFIACEMCKWWQSPDVSESYGECHGSPPTIVVSAGGKWYAEWPMTARNDYCKGFERQTKRG